MRKMKLIRKTVTTKQIEANQRNAQLSPGPTTPRGKQAIRGNARKLGLFAQGDLIFDDEDERRRFEDSLSELCESERAQGGLEKLLFEEALVARFKGRKAEKLGQKLLTEPPGPLATKMVKKVMSTMPESSDWYLADSGEMPEVQMPFRVKDLRLRLQASDRTGMAEDENHRYGTSFRLEASLADPIDTVYRAERAAKCDFYRAIDRLLELRKTTKQDQDEKESGDR